MPNIIHNWANEIVNSSEFNNLSQVKPNSILATKLQGNLKSLISNYINYIDYFISENDYGIYDALNKGIQNISLAHHTSKN